MYLKTLKPTYSGVDSMEKISMLIGYVEEMAEEISFRLESINETVENIKKDIYKEGTQSDEDS